MASYPIRATIQSETVVVDRHDGYLVAILATLTVGVLASLHPAVAAYQGLAVGSLAASVILFEMLFRNPPRTPDRGAIALIVLIGFGWAMTLLVSP